MRPALGVALALLPLALLAGPALANETPRAHPGTRASLGPSRPMTRGNPAQRRAVRGIALEESNTSESPELRALHRFEEEAFPRPGTYPPGEAVPDDVPLPLPPGLEGRWGGTGDVPPQLRSPERGVSPPPPKPGMEWLSRLELPDLPVRWEPQVIRYLEYFKNDPRGRSTMATWLRRMNRYRALIEQQLDKDKMPRDLIYLAMIESGFDPGATSLKAAGGIWQFIPGAARAYGLEVSRWVDGRRDPERGTEAAVHLLSDLYVRFGSWPLAFAAYNAGYGAVLRSIARYNTNDFWELARHEAGLPWETTLYVPKILAAAIIGHNLKFFGFSEVALDPPWQFDRVEVPSGVSFAALARAVGARPDVIEDLNPEYVANRIPPDRGPVTLRVPLGSATSYAKAGRDAQTAERLQTVVIRYGESLEEVAKAHGASVRELKRLNAVSDTAQLRGGMTILVPARSPAPSTSTSSNDSDDADDPILVAVPDRAFAYAGKERVFYRTREGDTLFALAAIFDVTVEDIVEWNNIDPRAKLQPKLILQLFVAEGFDRPEVVLLDPDKLRVVTLGSEEFLELETARRGKTRLFYSARAGDTLAKIAKRYGLAPGDLARVNRLGANSELSEGQRIVVYSPTPELPKEITRKVTGSSKKSTLAMKEASSKRKREASTRPNRDNKPDRGGKSDSVTKKEGGRSKTPSQAGKNGGRTAKAGDGNGKRSSNGKR